jgi:hypothetical protein
LCKTKGEKSFFLWHYHEHYQLKSSANSASDLNTTRPIVTCHALWQSKWVKRFLRFFDTFFWGESEKKNWGRRIRRQTHAFQFSCWAMDSQKTLCLLRARIFYIYRTFTFIFVYKQIIHYSVGLSITHLIIKRLNDFKDSLFT